MSRACPWVIRQATPVAPARRSGFRREACVHEFGNSGGAGEHLQWLIGIGERGTEQVRVIEGVEDGHAIRAPQPAFGLPAGGSGPD